MIEVEGVSYAIGDRSILSDVDLALPSGQVVAFLGPNGAGKSTLFGLMARLLPLQSGKVRFGGLDIGAAPARTVAQTLAILCQDNAIAGRLRVRELLTFGRYPYHQGRPSKADRAKVQAVIEDFELGDLAERFLTDLSGGQRQRALIAMVVCQDTPYALLDEPLNNLDMYHAGGLMRKLRRLADAGKTVAIVLHDINQAAQFADTIVMLQAGRVAAVGAPVDTITEANMRRLYGVAATVLQHKGKPVVVDAL